MQSTTIAGVDLSFRSPAVSVKCNGRFYCYFFPQNTRQQSVDFCNDRCTVKAVDVALSKITSTESQYHAIVSTLMQIIQHHSVSHVVIEGYAFNRKSAHSYKLYELGGVLKYTLAKADIGFTVVPPSHAKMRFTGKGNSNKVHMYEKWIEHGFPCLYSVFQLRPSPNNVPNPIQDIVDSVALLV